MAEGEWLVLVGMFGGFCAGVLNGWAWLMPMTAERRDAFLRGVSDGMNPTVWWRLIRRR